MTREQAKETVLTIEPDFLSAAKQKVNGHLTYICPKCGNGKGKDGDGITLDTSSKSKFPHWKCFGSCGLYADVIELWQIQNNITDFRTGLETLCNHYGISIDSDSPPIEADTSPVQPQQKRSSESMSQSQTSPETGVQPVNEESAPQPDYTDFFLQANQNLMNTNYHRGISLDTLNRFKVGYVEHWQSPKALREGKNPPTSPRLIIPTSKHSYIARDTRGNLTDEQKEFSKMKTGNVHIFNLSALWKSDKPVFIVEGEIDALSIIDVGGEAVGIGSTSMVNKLLETIQSAKQKPEQLLIIAFDNDKAGQDATAKLSEGLEKLNVLYFKYNIAKPYKDANEFLIQDRQGLLDKVKAVNLNPEQAIYAENNVYSHLQEFLDGIADSVNTPYIPTGFKALDSVLDGGFYEGLYIIGAISSLGKTTLAMQICDNIANSGNDVLMFSLEMARSELMAKSISRLTLLDILQNGGDTRNAKTARGITTGSRWLKYSLIEKELIQRAAETYGTYAKNIYIHEGIGDIGTSQIRQTVGNHIRITGKKPFVLIDYLQILAKADARTSDKQDMDRNVLELKRISRDFKIPVFVVSSFNRENYKTAVSYASFKESGAIEYSSDVLIGLQMKGAGEKGFDAETAKTKNPREIELVILKNRNGETGKKIEFKYYPMFNYFEEIGIQQKQARL